MGGASSCEGELWWRSGRWSSGGSSGGGFAGSGGIGIVVGGTVKAARAVLSKRELSMARALFANLVRRLLSCEGPRATHPERPATTDADRDRGL